MVAAGAIVLTAVLAGTSLYKWGRSAGGTGTPANVYPRAIPVTAFRGTEANPSFSPDGSQITFSWNGEARENSDIYIKIVGPGVPVRITTDPRPDLCPSWSRDGRSIAFLRQFSDNEVSLIVVPALGGRERALVNLKTSYILGASKPAWSIDSKWLVVTATMPDRNQQALARVSVENGQISWITEPDATSGLNDVMPALAPDGRQLAFSRVGGGFLTTAFVLPVSDALASTGQPKPLRKARCRV